ncbi:hypothetical protein EG329_005229 [Mollisiaceae sp. DMI_Dod_QoI]|nr:hypothetical protein EG329_005229 [Helotiales sp. DMI_Dod_QoI]
MASILLIWPQAFASPFASSSVAWIPTLRVLQKSSTFASVQDVEHYSNWLGLLYMDFRINAVVGGAAMTAKNPSYAFNSSQLPLRRYFNSSQEIPDGSTIDMAMPYFSVNLSWIDASSDNRSQNVGSTEYQDVDNEFQIRTVGALGIVRSTPWDADSNLPTAPSTFVGKKLVGVKLRTLNFGDQLPNGSLANANTSCPTVSEVFGQLPSVSQVQIPIGDGKEIVAYDCYIMAEATITAGKYSGRNCSVSSTAGVEQRYTTCSIQRDDSAIQDDWLSSLSLDFLSEVLKYTVNQNYSQPWISNSLDNYTSGMLTLGYHAAWSGLMRTLGNGIENVVFNPSQQVVSASIDKSKLYIWLAMNAMLTVSAILVYIAQSVSKTKTIRDSAIAALTIDMTDIAHIGRASGLCNAVSLSKMDHKLPRLRWKYAERRGENIGSVIDYSCCRTVVFTEEPTVDMKHRV